MTRSEQARADALADAETLRLYREPLFRNSSPIGRVEINLGVAEWYGVNCRYFISLAFIQPNQLYKSNEAETTTACAFAAFTQAQKAARAAFRAVPALRGGK